MSSPSKPTRQEAIEQLCRLAELVMVCATALADDDLDEAIQHAIEIPDLAELTVDLVKAAIGSC
jgi:hypothetical protein